MLQIHSSEPSADVPAPVLDVVNVRRADSVWVGLRGELDLTSLPQLRSALAQVDLRGAQQVHLLLAHLSFCDVGGMRELVRFADRARRDGIGFTTHGASPMLRKVAVLLGADQALGLV